MSRRRLALVTTGVFLIVVALASRFYVSPSLVRASLNQSNESVSRAEGATYLSIDRTGVSIRTNRAIRAVLEVRGDVAAGSRGVAVWNTYTTVLDDDGRIVSQSTDRVAMDRRAGTAVRCCEEALNGAPARHDGLTYKFPFSTPRAELQWFDRTLRTARPIAFRGETRRAGLRVYRFEQVIAETSLGQRSGVPGHLLDRPGVVDAEHTYATTRTFWVEPVSGVIVGAEESQRQLLRTTDGAEAVVLDATFALDAKTVAEAVDTARYVQRVVRLLEVIVPLLACLVGAALLALGLLRPRPRPPAPDGRHARDADEAPVPA